MLARLERAYLNFRNGMRRKFDEIASDDNGMATVEMVILIVVAVIIVGLVVNFLTKNGFESPVAGKGNVGLIEYLFDKIRVALDSSLAQAG